MNKIIHQDFKKNIFHFPTFYNQLTIRAKLALFTTILIVVISLTNLYFFYQTYIAINDYNTMLKRYSDINNLSICLIQGRDALSRYSITKEREELNTFEVSRIRTDILIQAIYNSSDSQETYLLSRAIQISLKSYQDEIRKMMTFPVGSTAYYNHFSQAKKISGYLESYIKQLLNVKLTEGGWYQNRMEKRVRLLRSLNIISIIVLALLSFLFVLIFSRSITRPLKKLTGFSASVAQGNFDLEPLVVNSSADINILAVAFNKMVQNIQEMIREITAKSDLERKLREEEYKNLKISEQLNKAKFLALQSQINPHFLFNTINTIMRTAMFENANKTSALIESLADLLHYNLDNQNSDVYIENELNVVRQYIAIQQVRFRNRIGFELDCPEALRHVIIPRFTIQPLVENAIIHGIEPQESGGKVRVKIFARGDQVIIKVIDNGTGISADRLKAILSAASSNPEPQKGHSGIGLTNVRERLVLFSKDPHCFKIQSKEDWGTVITIRLSGAIGGTYHD